MIEHIMDKIEALDSVDEVIVVTNERFNRQFLEWRDSFDTSRLPVTVINDHTVSNEDRRGAIGDIQYCIEQCAIDDDLLVIGGDNLFSFSLESLEKAFLSFQKPMIALYDVGDLELVKKYSVVSVDDYGKVRSFVEKPADPDSTLVSICIYLYPRAFLREISSYLARGEPKDAPGNLVSYLVREGYDVRAVSYEGVWFDIGSFASLEQADTYFRQKD
jgi:glucose-1-phosphate thymidylyltransferase